MEEVAKKSVLMESSAHATEKQTKVSSTEVAKRIFSPFSKLKTLALIQKAQRLESASTTNLLERSLNPDDSLDFKDAPRLRKTKGSLKLKSGSSIEKVNASSSKKSETQAVKISDENKGAIRSSKMPAESSKSDDGTESDSNFTPDTETQESVSKLTASQASGNEENHPSEHTNRSACCICGCEISRDLLEEHQRVCLKEKFTNDSGGAKTYPDCKAEKKCDICNKIISNLTVRAQQQHINNCLDKSEQEKQQESEYKQQLREAKDAVLGCPLCGRSFKSQQARQDHLKRCAKENGMTVDRIKLLMKQQEEDHAAKIEAGILPEEFRGKKKGVSAAAKAKRTVPSKISLDEDTQFALALSNSLMSDDNRPNADFLQPVMAARQGRTEDHAEGPLVVQGDSVKATAKGKKGKQTQSTSGLLTLSREEAAERISSRVESYIFTRAHEAMETTTPSFKKGSNLERSVRLSSSPSDPEPPVQDNSSTSSGNKTSLWLKTCTLGLDCEPQPSTSSTPATETFRGAEPAARNEKLEYYVPQLMPPVSLCRVQPGSKIKRVSAIPGRRKSKGLEGRECNIEVAKEGFDQAPAGSDPADQSQSPPSCEVPPSQTVQDLAQLALESASDYAQAAEDGRPVSGQDLSQLSEHEPELKPILSGLDGGSGEVSCASSSSSLTLSYRCMVNSSLYSDVSILAANNNNNNNGCSNSSDDPTKTIRAHKIILHVQCPKLMNLCVSQPDGDVIDLSDFDERAVLSLLMFLYSGGEEEVCLVPGLEQQILQLAHRFSLDKLWQAVTNRTVKEEAGLTQEPQNLEQCFTSEYAHTQNELDGGQRNVERSSVPELTEKKEELVVTLTELVRECAASPESREHEVNFSVPGENKTRVDDEEKGSPCPEHEVNFSIPGENETRVDDKEKGSPCPEHEVNFSVPGDNETRVDDEEKGSTCPEHEVNFSVPGENETRVDDEEKGSPCPEEHEVNFSVPGENEMRVDDKEKCSLCPVQPEVKAELSSTANGYTPAQDESVMEGAENSINVAATKRSSKKRKGTMKEFRQAVKRVSKAVCDGTQIDDDAFTNIVVKLEKTRPVSPVFYPSVLEDVSYSPDELSITSASIVSPRYKKKQKRTPRKNFNAPSTTELLNRSANVVETPQPVIHKGELNSGDKAVQLQPSGDAMLQTNTDNETNPSLKALHLSSDKQDSPARLNYTISSASAPGQITNVNEYVSDDDLFTDDETVPADRKDSPKPLACCTGQLRPSLTTPGPSSTRGGNFPGIVLERKDSSKQMTKEVHNFTLSNDVTSYPYQSGDRSSMHSLEKPRMVGNQSNSQPHQETSSTRDPSVRVEPKGAVLLSTPQKTGHEVKQCGTNWRENQTEDQQEASNIRGDYSPFKSPSEASKKDAFRVVFPSQLNSSVVKSPSVSSSPPLSQTGKVRTKRGLAKKESPLFKHESINERDSRIDRSVLSNDSFRLDETSPAVSTSNKGHTQILTSSYSPPQSGQAPLNCRKSLDFTTGRESNRAILSPATKALVPMGASVASTSSDRSTRKPNVTRTRSDNDGCLIQKTNSNNMESQDIPPSQPLSQTGKGKTRRGLAKKDSPLVKLATKRNQESGAVGLNQGHVSTLRNDSFCGGEKTPPTSTNVTGQGEHSQSPHGSFLNTEAGALYYRKNLDFTTCSESDQIVPSPCGEESVPAILLGSSHRPDHAPRGRLDVKEMLKANTDGLPIWQEPGENSPPSLRERLQMKIPFGHSAGPSQDCLPRHANSSVQSPQGKQSQLSNSSQIKTFTPTQFKSRGANHSKQPKEKGRLVHTEEDSEVSEEHTRGWDSKLGPERAEVCGNGLVVVQASPEIVEVDLQDVPADDGVDDVDDGDGDDSELIKALERCEQQLTQTGTPPAASRSWKPSWKEPSPFTPMLPYDSMATPLLKKAVEKIGVRPVGKKRMRELLKEVYHQTHQYETDSDYEATPLKRPRVEISSDTDVTAETRKSNNVHEHAQTSSDLDPDLTRMKDRNSQPAGPGFGFNGYSSAEPRIEPTTATGTVLDDVNYDNDNDADADDLPHTQDSSSSDGPDLAEESILQGWPEEDIAASQMTQTSEELTTDRLMEFVRSNSDIYEDVLMYRPLELDVLKKRIASAGIRVAMPKVIDFLDERCITFTMKNMSSRNNRNQKRPKKKEKPSQKQAQTKPKDKPSAGSMANTGK